MNNPSENTDSNGFDLFAPPEDDHLQEQLAKGTFQWTNKTTRILGVILLFVATLSAGAWYGHRTASSSGASSAAAFASLRAGRLNTNGNSASGAAALPGALPAGGFPGGGFSRGTPGTVTNVAGKTVTITLDQDPTTPLKSGDAVSLRPSIGGGAPTGASSGTIVKGTPSTKSKKSSTSTKSNSAATTTPAPVPSQGARRGGGFNNPELTACLEKEGVSLSPGARPDRTDPKIAEALQKCFAAVGGPGGPGGPGGGGFGNRKGSGTLNTPAPAPSN